MLLLHLMTSTKKDLHNPDNHDDVITNLEPDILESEMSAIVRSFEHSLHCLSLELELKLIFSSPVVTAEFSKFAGRLSAALSQHHLLGFEIAQLEFHHLH